MGAGESHVHGRENSDLLEKKVSLLRNHFCQPKIFPHPHYPSLCLYGCPSLRASSPIWASEVSLARTREGAAKPRGAEERRACNDLRALGCLNSTGGCHFSNRREVCGNRFHALRSPGVSGVEMKICERSLQALLCSVPRSRANSREARFAHLVQPPPPHGKRLYTG